MENEIAIFKNEAFGTVRTLYIEGQPWFVGKDIAKALGYSNSRKALADHVDEDDKGVTKRDTPGGTQTMTIINEAGVYSLIFSSKLPEAKVFKRWVTHEVLPSIRRHGVYLSDEVLERAAREPEYLLKLAEDIKEEKDLFESFCYFNLGKELDKLSKELKYRGRKTLSNILIENGYIYHDKKKGLTPYPEYLENNIFEIKNVKNSLGFRSELFSITSKGKEEIIRLIKEIKNPSGM